MDAVHFLVDGCADGGIVVEVTPEIITSNAIHILSVQHLHDYDAAADDDDGNGDGDGDDNDDYYDDDVITVVVVMIVWIQQILKYPDTFQIAILCCPTPQDS